MNLLLPIHLVDAHALLLLRGERRQRTRGAGSYLTVDGLGQDCLVWLEVEPFLLGAWLR